MGKREYFPAYFSYQRTLKWLTDEQLGRVFRAALEYAETGKEPDLEQIEMMGFSFMKEDIDRANEHYDQVCEARRASGSKGGRPKSQKPIGLSEEETKPNGFSENQMVLEETKKSQSESKSESKGNTKESIKKETVKRFTPPTLEEVRQYCNDQSYMVDAEQFIDFYSSKGWVVGKSPMKDWRAAVRNWVRMSKERGEYKQTSFVPQPDDYPF